jgi:DNA-binding transcriptional MocR family regulator
MGVGYLKLYRKTLDNPTVMKDADHLAIWMWLLMNAKFFPTDDWFGGERITLQPGQMITGRKKISEALGVSESKVQRVLKCYESEHMIEQRTNRQGRLITIVSWDEYQANEQPSEQRVNNERTTSEQRVNTITRKKERKNIRNNHSNTATADEKWGRYLLDSLLGDA